MYGVALYCQLMPCQLISSLKYRIGFPDTLTNTVVQSLTDEGEVFICCTLCCI